MYKNYYNNMNNFNNNVKEYGYQNSSIPEQTNQYEKTLKNFETEIREKKQILEKYKREIGKYENEYNQNIKKFEKEIKQKNEILCKINEEISDKEKKKNLY